MRRGNLLALVLLVPAAAWAFQEVNPREASVAAYISEPSGNTYHLPYAVPPHSKWARHSCPILFLNSAARRNYQGTTELLFNVKQDGSVAGIVVAASSFEDGLDVLSAACVSKWQYEPAMENGAPVEVPWEAHISWTQNGNRPVGDTPQIRLPATNCIRARPTAMGRAPMEKPTAVRYQLLNGEVTGAAVERSSGDASLDEYAARCVQTWHFVPAMENGNPATGSFVAVIYGPQVP